MKFAEPFWLLAGLIVVAGLFWLYRRFDLRQRAALADFASSHLLSQLTSSFSPVRRWIKRVLFAVAVALIFTALARPQFGYHWEEQKREGIDILFAIDTSKSMLTQDVTPDRLTRAKLAITDLVRKLEGDRVGLIAFAGDAFLQAPLTMDDDAFEESLDAIDTGVIPRGGTDIASAIREAQAAFTTETKNKKVLVLLTDGEDLEANGIAAAKAAAQNGLTIYTVGVGSAAGGLIPVPGDNGGTTFLKDDAGQYVKSHLDESTLKQIAEVTGGMYEPLGQQGEGLDAIYQKALASLPKQELASRRQRVYEERFQWPLAAGLVLLIASTLIGTRKRDKRRAVRPSPAARATAALGALTLATLSLSTHAQASPQSAERAYKAGDYPTAEKQYEQAAGQRPDTAPLQFDLGASAYKSSDYDQALPAFQKALKTDQIGVQQQAYYNMGNTQYRIGQKTEKGNPQDTIKTWQGAVASYNAALNLNPQDGDAQFNRDFVQKKLDQLQQQQNQKQKQDQKQDQKQQQDKNQQQQQQSKSQQNKDQKQDQQNQQGQNPQQQPGSQQNPNDQANQQKQGQQQGNQANQPDQQKPSSDSQQNQGQNGKPDQQKQAGNGNSQQNQNGQQGQQPKDASQGQQPTAANQPPQGGDQNQANGQPGSSSLGQNGEKPAGPVGPTVPDKTPAGQQTATAAEPDKAEPGQMTGQEARELLNSLKNGEHALPVTADARNGDTHANQQPLKDW
jgi:Ca-activated chloride channel family protein